MAELTGRRALVTGSSRGIGRALAEGLLEAGADVVLNGVDPARLTAAAEDLRARFAPDRVHVARFDVRDEDSVGGGVEAIESRIGPIDIAVNSAGIQHRVPLIDLELADWRRVLDINLTGVFLVGRAVARGMIARGRGKIVNIASVQADLARPTIGAYTASKGGVRNLTRAMAAEWSASGVQVNALAPGYIATEMTAALRADPEFDGWVKKRTPAGRWGTPEDLVGPAVWLCSSASDFVTGQTIFVDGGMTTVV